MTTLGRQGLLTAFIVCLTMQSVGVFTQAVGVIDDLAAYEVYAAVVRLRIINNVNNDRYTRVAFLEETRTRSACRGIDLAWKAVWDSHRANNMTDRLLQPGFDLGLPYDFVKLADVKALLLKAGNDGTRIRGGWSEAYASFPNNRLWALSAVGFDESKTRAIVTLQYNCGLSRTPRPGEYDCHGGGQVLLVKEVGQWVLANINTCGWIA